MILSVIWAVVFLVSSHAMLKHQDWDQSMLMWDIWSRYILCVPGAFLTGLALLLYVPHVEPARVKTVTQNLKIAGHEYY
ncbi:MAG: hypothetical protein FVQ82_07915 [Planctomycetes bacterium]|nr:hypothetical protein [Planctomycetota bacterium]